MNNETGTTTVKADLVKIQTVKRMGHGMLSRAFRAGLDMLIDGASMETHELQMKRDVLKEDKIKINAKLANIEAQLSNIKLGELPTVQTKLLENDNTVNEFIRCSSSIIYEHKTQLIEYLAGLKPHLTPEKVRTFYKNRNREPTREEIIEFLR